MPVHFALDDKFELPEKFKKSFFSVLSIEVSTSLLSKQTFARKIHVEVRNAKNNVHHVSAYVFVSRNPDGFRLS